MTRQRTGEGDLKSAAPTLKERAETIIRNAGPALGLDERDIKHILADEDAWCARGLVEAALAASESAPPAAERTTLERIRQKIEAIPVGGLDYVPDPSMTMMEYEVNISSKPHSAIWFKYRVRDILKSEIDASEGTKSE